MNNGAEIKATGKAIIPSEDLYFKKGITWSRLGGGRTAFRMMPAGIIPGDTGPCAFPEKDEMLLHAYLNSGVVRHFLEFLVPSLTFLTGDIEKLPYDVSRFDVIRTHVSELASQAVAIAKENWDRTTYSWDFERPPFIDASFRDAKIEDVFTESTSSCRKAAARIANIEAEICSAFAAAFNLDETLKNPAVEELITLSLPSMRDEVESYIEFSVGCILGRYSVDKPGLILANHGETIADYHNIIPEPTFVPDSNNVLPILEGEWFSADISQRFKDFLKITFGAEHYDENLEFLENSLYPDNPTSKKRKTIRDYFMKEFYDHHLKLYKKRPIYWLFSSPKGTFNALIYMHRYRPETVGKVLECLRDFREKLAYHAEHRQMTADSANASKTEKTQAVKEVAAIKKQLKELEDYEKTLFEVAAKKIPIDLDDGVKHNYPLFGSVLRKIPGLDAKDD